MICFSLLLCNYIFLFVSQVLLEIYHSRILEQVCCGISRSILFSGRWFSSPISTGHHLYGQTLTHNEGTPWQSAIVSLVSVFNKKLLVCLYLLISIKVFLNLRRDNKLKKSQLLCIDNALMFAHQSVIINNFLAPLKYYITHNPPARTEDIIHGVSQPMPVFCFEVTGSQRNRIPEKQCHPARTGIKNILKMIISKLVLWSLTCRSRGSY